MLKLFVLAFLDISYFICVPHLQEFEGLFCRIIFYHLNFLKQ